jgi:hypothetical protein
MSALSSHGLLGSDAIEGGFEEVLLRFTGYPC